MQRSFAFASFRLSMTFVGILVLAPSFAFAQAGTQSAIRAVLDRQVAAWNRHDLEGFMAGYWRSPELTFFSGKIESQGWDAALERYRKNYQGEGKEMGTLDFSGLVIVPLGRDAAFVRGRFHLLFRDGKESSGIFTLVLRKFPEGWRIIHDHTS
jgi:ketosteroid isomerase-like protein